MSGSTASAATTRKSAAATAAQTNGLVLQRQCACGQHTIAGGECDECAERRMSLQRRATSSAGTPTVPPSVYEVLNSPGQPLDADMRAFMERRLGHDFSSVRVHSDGLAAESARGVNAAAYTVGRDVVFGAGEYLPSTDHGRQLLAHELTHVIQQGRADWASAPAPLEVAPAGHSLEVESQRSAEAVRTGTQHAAAAAVTAPAVQRATEQEGAVGEGASAAPAPETRTLIVDDDAAEAAPGQMRKTEFLDGLRAHVCEVADRALISTGRTAQGCPLIEHWIGRMRTRRAGEIERSIRRYAPETGAAATAREIYAAVGERVRQGVERWAKTGDLTGVPPELLREMGGGGIAGFLSSVGGFISGVGRLFGKARSGGLREADPAAVRAQLRPGAPLENGLRAKMEHVFGRGFGSVRVHADSSSAAAAAAVNARAFTIGDDLAFGPGEYQPGTPAGDALIAHELAHVAQQSDAASGSGPGTASLEADADRSAFEAAAALWAGNTAARPRDARPRLRSGIRLQRCHSAPKLRNPADVEREFASIRNQLTSGAASTELGHEIDHTFSILQAIYKHNLNLAGTDQDKQAWAQDDLLTQAKRLRDAFQVQLEMTRRYQIVFTAFFTPAPSGTPGRSEYKFHTWSADELRQVDDILKKAPPGSLANIQKIQRQMGTEVNVPAAWTDSTKTLEVYDEFFASKYREDDRVEALIHEVGHSTEVDRTVGSFQHLPSPEWMALSDWKTATGATFGRDIGVSGDDIADGKKAVERARTSGGSFPRPARVGKRMVVVDRYAPRSAGEQYLHYDADRDDQFVTDYARSHPADDLAESYAWFVLHPDETQDKLDVGKKGAPNKWNYLVRRLQQNAAAAGKAVKPKLRQGEAADPCEREADRAADAVTSTGRVDAPLAPAPVGVQRMAAEGAASRPSAVPQELGRGRTRALVVEDDAARLEPGQMRKTQFLDGLQRQACEAAEPALASTGRTAQGCPVIERWIGRLRTRHSADVEGAIRRYAPEAAGAASAREYYPVVAQRVRTGVARWAATGDTSGVPPELLRDFSEGIGLSDAFAMVKAGVQHAIGSVRRLFAKARPGGAASADPAEVAGRLGSGAALETGVRRKMESAFGQDFGGVRVHTGTAARSMAAGLNARAFTVGSDIVFDDGEYRPGDEVGDALVAHELAHVVQQRNGSPTLSPAAHQGESQVLEADANRAAAGAIGRERALPARHSGLRIQSCGRSQRAQALPSLQVLSAMSSWQISQISTETFAQAPTGDAGIARQYADYARASRLAKKIYSDFKVAFDIERENRRLGRTPTPAELQVIDNLMRSVLNVPNVRTSLAAPGARGVPTPKGAAQPSLSGHAMVLRDRTEYGIKSFQLQWLVAGSLGLPTPELDKYVRQEWDRLGIQSGDHPTITNQERRLVAFENTISMMSMAPGFYFPPDDTFYLAPQASDLRAPETQSVARHEIVHLLGGRDRTRQAFLSHYGPERYIKYWSPFEEGMAELINMEANPAQTGLSAPGAPETSSAYGEYVKMMNELMRQPGMSRDKLFKAYFTGNIPQQVFEWLQTRVRE